jgi:hypothetical protein
MCKYVTKSGEVSTAFFVFTTFFATRSAKNAIDKALSDQEEKKAGDDDCARIFMQKYTLEKIEELQKAKVAFEEAKKKTGIEIEFSDL